LADASLNPSGSQVTVIMNTQDVSQSIDDKQNDDKTSPESPGSRMLDAKRMKEGVNVSYKKKPVMRTSDGKAFIEIRDVLSSGVLVLLNRPEKEEGSLYPDK
jgi:hypothetical protein